MRHAIDPKIDCVFKALLGSEENRNLLIHFLNAFLAPDLIEPLVWVEILNPPLSNRNSTDQLRPFTRPYYLQLGRHLQSAT